MAKKYFEIEDVRRSINRKMWVVITVLGLVSLFSIFSALVAYARPFPVVVIDSQGKPMLFEDTSTPRQHMTDLRVRYFTKEFLKKFIGVNSAMVAENLADALNVMTPAYRHIVSNDHEEQAQRLEYKDKNIRSQLRGWEVQIAEYNPEELGGRIFVLASGELLLEPMMGKLTEKKSVSRWFLSKVVLQRVPVSELSIHGLLVHYCESRFFESLDEYKNFLVKLDAAD